LATPNNFTLTNATAIASTEFSTGVGSTYSDQFSIANGLGTGTSGYGGTVRAGASTGGTSATNSGARAIRIANSYQNVSPSISGITFSYATTLQNNNKNTDSRYGNTVGVTEYALRYTNGPIDAAYTSCKYDLGSNGTSQIGVVAPTATATTPTLGVTSLAVQHNTQNLLGVKYTVMQGLTLNAGFGNFTSSSGTYSGSSKT